MSLSKNYSVFTKYFVNSGFRFPLDPRCKPRRYDQIAFARVEELRGAGPDFELEDFRIYCKFGKTPRQNGLTERYADFCTM